MPRTLPVDLPPGDFVPVKELAAELGVTGAGLRRPIREGHIRAIRHGGRDLLVDRGSARAYFVRPVGEPADGLSAEDREFVAAVVAAAPALDSETRSQIAALLPAVGGAA